MNRFFRSAFFPLIVIVLLVWLASQTLIPKSNHAVKGVSYSALQGQIDLGILHYRTYSVFLIVIGVLIVIALWLGFERTRMGAQIRAAVDNWRMAESLGINIGRLFTITFAFGSGMAALGGGLGAEFLGLDVLDKAGRCTWAADVDDAGDRRAALGTGVDLGH